jgi:hypothetical protein
MIDERQSWRKAFEMIGPDLMRLRLESRRNEFPPAYAREAEIWLLEKDGEKNALEISRFRVIRRWAIVAGVAGIVAAIGGVIGAWPVVRDWIHEATAIHTHDTR